MEKSRLDCCTAIRVVCLVSGGNEFARSHACVTRSSSRSFSISMIGYCEKIQDALQFLSVEGWLRSDAFEGGDAHLVALVDGVRVAEGPVGAPMQRDDLDSAGAGAFQALLAGAIPAQGQLEVALKTTGGIEILRALSQEEREPFLPSGSIDYVDRVGIRGWVFDPATWLTGVAPRLLLDGISVELPLNELREEMRLAAPEGAKLGFFHSWQQIVERARGIDPTFVLKRGTHPVSLESSGIALDTHSYEHSPQIRGRIERTREGQLLGWAVDGEIAHMPAPLDVFLDGVRYRSARAGRDRADLVEKGIAPHGGGFRIPLPSASPTGVPDISLSIGAGLTGELLDGGPIPVEDLPPRRRDRTGLLQSLPVDEGDGIAIVVPIYKAAEDLARCLDALARSTTRPARLILIDDASGCSAVDGLLAEWRGRANVEVHVNDANRGFTGTVNRGIALAGRADVVLLNSDTMVTPGWLEGLRTAAYSEPGVATVTPLSNNAGAFSVPEIGVENRLSPGFDVDDQSRLVRQASLGLMPAVPTGNGFCLYIRRSCLDLVGSFDEAAFPRGYGEENDFCMRAWRQGMLHLIDDRTYVYHRRGASFGGEKEKQYAAGREVVDRRYPEYSTLTSVYADDPDMLAIRWRIRRAMADTASRPSLPRPRALFVISTLSGGTPQTNADLMAALSDRYEPWVLRCDSKRLELSRWEAGEMVRVEEHVLMRPIHGAVHRSSEYDARVADLIVRHGFEIVHIRHIAWHGIGLSSVCRGLGVPVVFSFHDFYTLCPNTKLLDHEKRYCAGKCTAGDGDCIAELWPKNSIPNLKHQFIGRWREMFATMLAECDAFVTTSPGARDVIRQEYEFLRDRDFRVIPHARDFAVMDNLAAVPSGGEPLRILVPGNISAAKGAELLEEIAGLDADGEIEFHILGDHGAIQARDNVIVHGRYKRSDFARIVRDIRPHLGAILSIWPETYSHTLTEMWACGVPVFALDIGAVAERIRESGGGWLEDVGASPDAVLRRLINIKRDRRDVRARGEQVLDWQRTIGATYDTSAMAASYDRLYREIFHRRRVFGGDVVPRPVALVLGGGLDDEGGRVLAERTRNHVGRSLIFRPIPASFPWREALLEPADLVLVRAIALRPFQIPDLVDRCAEAGLPIVVDAAGWPGENRGSGRPEDASLLKAAALTLAESEAQLDALKALWIEATLLEPQLGVRRWERVILGRTYGNGELPPAFMLYKHDGDAVALRNAIRRAQ